MSARRLENGGRIDRKQRIEFSWDGRRLRGYAGDSLASALLANNQQVLGRSFKYHRPRGIISARSTACSGAFSPRAFTTRLSWAFRLSSGSARAPGCG